MKPSLITMTCIPLLVMATVWPAQAADDTTPSNLKMGGMTTSRYQSTSIERTFLAESKGYKKIAESLRQILSQSGLPWWGSIKLHRVTAIRVHYSRKAQDDSASRFHWQGLISALEKPRAHALWQATLCVDADEGYGNVYVSTVRFQSYCDSGQCKWDMISNSGKSASSCRSL